MRAAARPAGKAGGAQPGRFAASLRRLLAGSTVLFALPLAAQAQEAPPLPRTNLGTVGLIEMPSARMGTDGELSAGASFYTDTQHYNLGFQILPWLEGSFRYSGLQHFAPAYPVYWDRSFGIKAHLLQESDLIPSVAIGINDVVGTGIYSSEYLVASKQFGDFDTTLGIGWGRLGSANTFRNPFAQLSRSFENRASFTSPGGADFNVFFHGPTTGVFGGVTWRTPISGLSLIVEASSDNYEVERDRGGFTPKSQMNYGLSYEATDSLTLGLNWLYGTTIGGSVNFHFDPRNPQYPGSLDEPPVAPALRTPEQQQASLRYLLGQRNPMNAVLRATAQARAQDRDGFVDALLDDRDIRDVSITGQTLSVSIAGTGAGRVCRSVAASAATSGTGITGVAVKSEGRILARCAVPRTVQPSLQSAAFLSTQNLPGLIQASAQIPTLTIDATAREAPVDTAAALRKFRADARKQHSYIEAVEFGDTTATVYYVNAHFFHEADQIERLIRLLMQDAPPRIEKFRLISVASSVPQEEYDVLRAPTERAFAQNGEDASAFDGGVTIAPPPMDNPVLRQGERHVYPRFDWSIYPQFRQQFFDPTNPFGVQFLGAGQASVELAPGLLLWGEGEISAFDTFATARESDSVLPHVRTDYLHYFTEGKNGIGALQLDYRSRIAPNVFVTFKAGYLESMFAGVGGEVLYRPEGQRWAIGGDLYEVQQRNFDRLFGLRDYRATTGHITLYYDSPWYDLNFQLRAGQYLAGDRGLTLQVTRRFSTGVEIGAFFTKTNVSSAQFGEGSFDKGIIIRIPLNWIAPIETQSQVAMDLRPVQRDGGQTLLGDATLYDETRRSSESEIVRGGYEFAP